MFNQVDDVPGAVPPNITVIGERNVGSFGAVHVLQVSGYAQMETEPTDEGTTVAGVQVQAFL